ncbi:MAG: putative transport system ATP-binding protein [Firmicutes bacterium]|nr:putative transport system ATP-binding protein [Bacillota bacterium]
MEKMIHVENLVKQYDKAKAPSVKGINFNVSEGEFFAFLGPNGAGKTTTISILTTTLSKTSGNVTIAGFDVNKEARQVRENVGIIFQQPSLDPNLSAEENIRFHACLYGMYGYRPSFKMMPKEYRNRVLELSEIIGIQDSLFKPIKKLSGGMQRKFEIIRSLIHTPKILFLDEPTQGLDAVSRRGLWDYINTVRHDFGTTVFLTTHYIDEAEHVDRVCIINQGQISFDGTPDIMKQSLLKQEVILDSYDRLELTNELISLGLNYRIEDHVIVPFQDLTPQEIISGLTTKLSLLRMQEPTLEDAYVDYLLKSGGNIA